MKKNEKPKTNSPYMLCCVHWQNGLVRSYSPTLTKPNLTMAISWSVSINDNIILLLKTISNKAKWERQYERTNAEEKKSETNSEKNHFVWNEILSNFAFLFLIVQSKLCTYNIVVSCLSCVYKSFASIPFNDCIPTSRLSFIRFSNSANYTCPKISAEWKFYILGMNTMVFRSITIPEESGARAHADTTNGGCVHEHRVNFRAKNCIGIFERSCRC